MNNNDLEAQSENNDLEEPIDVDIELEEDVVELIGIGGQKPLKKKLKSKVWNFFDILPLGSDKKLRSAYKKCGQQYLAANLQNMGSETTVSLKKSKKASKKRAASDPDHSTSGDIVDIGNGEVADGVLVDDDLNEPTMGEKLATLNLVDGDIENRNKNDELPLAAKPPRADSVHVLLRQALHADDRALLLNYLYTQDEKVIAKSISLFNPSDVSKLLQSLISSIQSRGAILACALPWLRCLLLQHASGIMSQEFSIVSLNSLYQLIESRVSTFHSALQLSSVLGVLYADIVDDEVDESNVIVPVIIEDKDESDEEESEDTMENRRNQRGR
ncbi:WD repeat-containing protein 43-like isoform X2 [Morus notabilis]|uniref:WD repeat-containing protein 43-like isoform X2 n=1 Tax=Morus notabilis TaxID=981085 RepID=UPI000CED51F3|nr:WD repeat-containing protein 43-like isoform X2 [Morus notabilis]